MTLSELDAMIEASPNTAAALLTEFDWKATMRDPRAAEHQERRQPSGVNYRGVRIWTTSTSPSRLLSLDQASELGLLEP